MSDGAGAACLAPEMNSTSDETSGDWLRLYSVTGLGGVVYPLGVSQLG